MPVTRDYTDHFDMNITPIGGTVTLSFLVAWSDVDDVLAEIFPPTSGGSIAATELDPYLLRYRAKSVKLSKVVGKAAIRNDVVADPNDVVPRFDQCLVTVTYNNEQSELPADQDEADADGDPVPFLNHTWSAGTELVEQETTEAKFTGGASVKANTPVSSVIPIIQHQVEWTRVVSPPFASIRSLLGKVNDLNADFATGTILPETLLFTGASLSREYMSNGSRAWSLGYQFAERRVNIINGMSVDRNYVYDEDVLLLTNEIRTRGLNLNGDPKYGGWNHFYDSGTEKGFSRLFTKTPDPNSTNHAGTYWIGVTSGVVFEFLDVVKHGAYHDDVMVYKKGDFSLLFTQV